MVATFEVPLEGFPVRAIVREGKFAEALPHRHAAGQLLYTEYGTSLLEVNGRMVRMGPERAAWIPPNAPHALLMERPFRYHSVYVDPAFYTNDRFSVVVIRPLLKALILDMCSWTHAPGEHEQRCRKALVIVDELARAPLLAPGLPVPTDARIVSICRALEADPGNRLSLREWASETGTSGKTIERLFLKQTGMSFYQWRNFARMARARDLHAQGMRGLDIAVVLGYCTEGGYAQAFKKFYGFPPSHLKKRAGGELG